MNVMFDFDNLPDRHNTRSVKWDEAAADVLPLWVADMDFGTAPCVQRAVMQRALHPCYGYTLVPDAYYQSVIRWFWERHGWHIRREEILYTIGVVPAIAAILRTVCQTGDQVAMLSPVYNCFYSCIRNAGATPALVSLERTMGDDGLLHYTIAWERLEAALADARTTVMLLCNPHNPVGRVWSTDELQHIAMLCARHHVMVISDEIHNELTMPGTLYVPFGVAAADVEGLTYCVCTSPSKAFNIAGLQNANIMVPDAELRRRIDRAINLNETCDVNPFGVEALMAAYDEGTEWLDALRQYVWKNYAYARAYLNKELPALRIADMQATYLMWVDYSALSAMPSQELCLRLTDEAKVWLCAGAIYGMDGEHHLRINLATSRKVLEEALSRFTRWAKTNF